MNLLIHIIGLFCLVGLYIADDVQDREARGLIGNKCLLDTNCNTIQYCDQEFPNPVGTCKDGHKEGEACLKDSHCASKQCHFFKCKKRIEVKDGPCKISADCNDQQYCDEIPGRKELKQCFDRKCKGSCLKDSECLSNNCHLFQCVKGDGC